MNSQWENHVLKNPASEIPAPPSDAPASSGGCSGSLEIAAAMRVLLQVDGAVAAAPEAAAGVVKRWLDNAALSLDTEGGLGHC
jgi:hypothetical protein